MRKSEKQDLLNEIERLHKRIEQEEKLNFSRTAQITHLETELSTRDKVVKTMFEKNKELQSQISELETELRVKESRPSIEWYEERYQSDCITINQLHTTIDVLTDKLARLRGQMGL